MSIIIPGNREEVLQDMQTDFVANIPESDPFIRESWLYALLIAISFREFDIYTQIEELLLNIFPDTAVDVFARQWGSLKGVQPNPAASATGLISVTGVAGSVIPIGTTFANESGNQYLSENQSYTIVESTISVSSIISSGGIAEVTTTSSNNLATDMSVVIDGADQVEYNGTFPITVTGEDTFKYSITGSPASPATGTITVTATFVSVFVQASSLGETTNLDSGAQLTLVNPIAGVDNTSYVQFTGLGGGADVETNEQYRERYLERFQNQATNFNVANIINTAKNVPGVTRVFVQRITPEPGDTTILPMRDNDTDPIPNGQEIDDIRSELLNIVPAHTEISDTDGMIVRAPTPVYVDFVFTNLTPNTSTMQDAVRASLADFFKTSTAVATPITQLSYSAAIKETVDPATGSVVDFFTLSQPVGDISIGVYEIGVLSGVTFNV